MPSDQSDEIAEPVVRPDQPPSPVFGESPAHEGPKQQTQNAGNTPPSSISLEESFDIAYAHLRAKGDKNLIEEMEKEVIRRALQECGGNQVKASALLGITRATLRKRIDSYEIKY